MIGRLKVQGDKPWNITIIDPDTGESVSPFYRIEYVTDVQKGEHYIKLYVHECDVDLDVTAPVEITKETESLPVVHVEPDIKKLAKEVMQELARQTRMSGGVNLRTKQGEV